MVQSMRAAGTDSRNRRRGPALCAVVLAAAALGGCANLGGSTPASAGLDQAASWRVAGPVTPSSSASRTAAKDCYGGPSGLVDDCGPFVRYDGP